MPTATPTPAASPTVFTCREKKGQVVIAQITTPLLPAPLDFRVYLPPCYEQQLDRSYPTLYLIHGQSFTDDQWDRLGVDETLNRLITYEEVSPFLIIMPRDRLWSQPDEDPFGQAVVDVLLPWIDSNYRTFPDRQHRAIGGLSRGAAWAVNLGLKYWGSFGAIGAHSLPVFWADIPYIKKWLEVIPPQQMPRIYLDIGDRDRPEIMESATWFEELLTEQGVAHEWHLFSGFHEEDYWKEHIEQYLRWYAQEW